MPRPAAALDHQALPRPLTSFFGRDAAVAAVLALLVDDGLRLLTLTGPGGVGKTRLALRIAEEATPAFVDGVVFVPLATINDPELVLPSIARALGLRDDATRSPGERLVDELRDCHILLVLDNFEQVHPAATDLGALLGACPSVAALVTSRAPLRVSMEQRFPVLPLALPDAGTASGFNRPEDVTWDAIVASPAVQLFVARSRAVDPRFALNHENAATVAALCRRLDGLPLAIELAAARSSVLTPRDLLDRVDAALPLLSDGPADAPDRLRTMRQAIRWSYDLLSSPEQVFFRRLAVFAGSFPLDAAEAVAGDNALELVASLLDKNLLRRVEESADARFAMLETIRAFGLEQLAQAGEADAIAARHATWCVGLADRVRQSGGLSQVGGLAALEASHADLRAALGWLLERGRETATALHLAGQLAEFWMRHGHLAEGEAWLTRALAADTGPPTAARAGALVGLNMLLWQRQELPRAKRILAEAERVAREANDAGAVAYVRIHQGFIAAFAGDFELAAARAEEVLATHEAIPQGFNLHGPLWLLAFAALARGENERAAPLYDRLLASAQASGDQVSLANGLYGHAVLAECRSDLGSALQGFVAAATVCWTIGDRFPACHNLDHAAVVLAALDRPEAAVRLFAVADAQRTRLGTSPLPFADDRQRLEQARSKVRAALGDTRFATAWAAGSKLMFDEAIAEAAALATWASSSEEADAAANATRLTPRERDVMRGLVNGLSDKEIAAVLGIGRRTVSDHVVAIRRKLGAPSRTAAATIAVREGFA